jgi:hypothetical protein
MAAYEENFMAADNLIINLFQRRAPHLGNTRVSSRDRYPASVMGFRCPLVANPSSAAEPNVPSSPSWGCVGAGIASSGYDFGGPSSTAMMAGARYRGVLNDGRHGIASAHSICPSKPSVFAMSR